MSNQNKEVFEFISNYVSKSDVYATTAIAKISAFIYKRRKELGMSQKAFAKMMEVTQGMVSKWESAEYNFTIESIAQISEKLNVTFDIEFSPESEYLLSNVKNEYENSYTISGVDIATIISYNDIAA